MIDASATRVILLSRGASRGYGRSHDIISTPQTFLASVAILVDINSVLTTMTLVPFRGSVAHHLGAYKNS